MANEVENGESTGGFDNLFDDGSKAAEDIFATNPNEWTENQTIGVVIGSSVLFVLFLVLWWFCQQIKEFCRRKLFGSSINPRHTLAKPYVLRRGARAHQINSSDKLPQGCVLHGAEKLHTAGLDGRGVRVAIIDTGIDKQHPDLEDKVVKQVWYRSGTPLSIDDHGTHVAGTIHFMAPKANLYDYRVIGKEGEIESDAAVAQAIRDAVAEGCQIINISIRISYPVLKAIRRVVKYAHGKGVVMVCATGNYPGNDDPTINHRFTYPAKWSQTVSVAAVKKGPGGTPVASFSDVIVGTDRAFNVDFAAVGQDVLSLKPGGGYQIMSGTSVAAPHLTGMLAAMMTGGGDVKKRAKKLMSQLRATYAFDVTAKGSDGNSTQLAFPTFLTKWEFEKCWRQHSSGGFNINNNPSTWNIGDPLLNRTNSGNGRSSLRRSVSDKSPTRRHSTSPSPGRLSRQHSGNGRGSFARGNGSNRKVGPSDKRESFRDRAMERHLNRSTSGNGRKSSRRSMNDTSPSASRSASPAATRAFDRPPSASRSASPAASRVFDRSPSASRSASPAATRAFSSKGMESFNSRNSTSSKVGRSSWSPSAASSFNNTLPRQNGENGKTLNRGRSSENLRHPSPEKGRQRSRSGNGRIPRARSQGR